MEPLSKPRGAENLGGKQALLDRATRRSPYHQSHTGNALGLGDEGQGPQEVPEADAPPGLGEWRWDGSVTQRSCALEDVFAPLCISARHWPVPASIPVTSL